MTITDLSIDLCRQIQKTVKPLLGKTSSKRIKGHAVGGDSTFEIDEIAEEIVADYLEREGDIAYYSEDKGLVSFGSPRAILIIDPIDGTRPAAAGLESCCVSIAASGFKKNPKLGDVYFGAVQEIKNDCLFLAEKGKGVKAYLGDREIPLSPGRNEDLVTLFWTLGFRGRPAIEMMTVLAELVDKSSTDGGVFDVGSASFSITRLVTGQLDAYIDIGKRMIEEAPWVTERFRQVAHGHILNNSPYDIAASLLVATEAGCVATDGYGRPLDDYDLLGSDNDAQLSCILSTGAGLHQQLVEAVDKGIERLKNAGEIIRKI